MRIIFRLHQAPYWIRFSLLTLVAIGINMLGLGLTEWLGWSLLFFDMVGTAVASLLGGAAAGLLVALGSCFLGSLATGDPTYFAYGYVNIIGALSWSVLPRTGRPIFGCYLFNLGAGATYRRAFSNILLLGTVAGFATSLASWAITVFVLHGPKLSSYGAGTATGTNNNVLTQNLVNITHASAGIAQQFVVLIASILTNVPDKIIATASATVLIIAYRTLPNYKEQKKIIRTGITSAGAKIVANRFLLIAICLLQSFVFPYNAYILTGSISQTGVMFLFSLPVLVVILIDPIYFKSIDRLNNEGTESPKEFYQMPENYHMGHHKAVFEDILKLMAIAVSGVSFLIAMSGATACVPETLESLKRCGPLYELAAVNALIVTGFRYACVVVMRLSNRH